jgi:hypothetical protein
MWFETGSDGDGILLLRLRVIESAGEPIFGICLSLAKIFSFRPYSRRDGETQGRIGRSACMRLRILSNDEIEALYGRPRFTHDERVEYFSLSPAEKAALEQLHYINAKIYFILQLGYFKASMMFFVFKPREAEEDIQFIRERYFPNYHDSDLGIGKVTRLKQQGMILKLGNYRGWNAKQQAMLEGRARQAAMVCSKPIYVFRELMHFLEEQRILPPGYSTMQDIVGGALAYEQRRLADIAKDHVDQSAK